MALCAAVLGVLPASADAVDPRGWFPGRTMPRDVWVLTVNVNGFVQAEWSPGLVFDGKPLDMVIGCGALKARVDVDWWRPIKPLRRPKVQRRNAPPPGWLPRRTLPIKGRVMIATLDDMNVVSLSRRGLIGCGANYKRAEVLWWRPLPRVPRTGPDGKGRYG
jgi:hypothetical protein